MKTRRTLRVLAAIFASLAVLTLWAGSASATNDTNTNEVAYWCEGGHGIKYDNLTSTSFTVPAPPSGWTWTLLVLKAGSDVSVPTGANETFPNPVVGQSYSHSSGKTLSHAILCKSYTGTTTTTAGSTTTAASTTIATTTTAPTTTQGTTTTTMATTTTGATTTAATTTTQGTTTTVATTVPQTTTTAATTTQPPCDVAHNCRCVDCNVPTTTVAVTTTVPVTTIPDTTAADQTVPPALIPPAVVTPAPTTVPAELPHTGTNSDLAAGGFALLAVGLGLASLDRRRFV